VKVPLAPDESDTCTRGVGLTVYFDRLAVTADGKRPQGQRANHALQLRVHQVRRHRREGGALLGAGKQLRCVGHPGSHLQATVAKQTHAVARVHPVGNDAQIVVQDLTNQCLGAQVLEGTGRGYVGADVAGVAPHDARDRVASLQRQDQRIGGARRRRGERAQNNQ